MAHERTARALLLATVALGCARPAPPAAMGPTDGVAVQGIAQVGLLVGDLEKARAFYAGFLGLPARPGENGGLLIDVSAGQTLELRPGPAGSDGRLHHVSLYAGSRAAELRDPDGHVLRLIEGGVEALDLPARQRPLPAGRIATHLAHVGLLVGSVGAAAGFYQRGLGLRETWRGSGSGRTLDWVNLASGGGDYLELMLYTTLPPPEERGVKNHVCLFTPDVAAAAAVLQARAASAGYTRAIEVKVGKNHKRQANLYDPDGTRIELMEPHTVDGQPAPPSDLPPPRP